MSMTLRAAVFVVTCTILRQQSARAGGPVDMTGGTAVVWQTGKSIVFSVDRGGLGSLKEAVVFDVARTAFAQWSAVPTATLRFDLTHRSEDIVTADDYTPFEKE